MAASEVAADGDAANAPRITIEEDGPYIVSGAVALTVRNPVLNSEGEPVAWSPPARTDRDERHVLPLPLRPLAQQAVLRRLASRAGSMAPAPPSAARRRRAASISVQPASR